MNDDSQSARLRALEQRVAHLEAMLGVESSPAPAEPPPLPTVEPPPLPPAGTLGVRADGPPTPVMAAGRAGRAEPAPPRETKDLERFVGLAVLGRVGAAALLLAAAYFGQLGWTRLGPVARVALIYLAGGLMVALGLGLRARVLPRYTALLAGAGTALTYLGGALACLHYQLLPATPAMLLLLASAALGQWLGRLLQLQAFATVALAGAYAAPVLVGTPSPSPTGFFALLVLLHSWAAWTQWRWSWHQARLLAVVATAALVWGWYAENGRVTTGSMLLHLEVVLVCVSAPEWLSALAKAQLGTARWFACMFAWSVVQLLLLHLTWWNDEYPWFGLTVGSTLLAAGVLLAPATPRFATGPARLGGVLFVLGAAQVWHLAEATRLQESWAHIGSLSAAALLVLALRRWTLVGEFAAVLATLLALLLQLGLGNLDGSRPLVAPVVSASLVLLWFGRMPAPVFGLLLGCVAALFGLCREFSFAATDEWLPIGLAISSGVAVLAVLKAGLHRERALRLVAVMALVALGGFWLAHALQVVRHPDTGESLPLLWNLRSASAAVMLAACIAGGRALPAEERQARAVLGTTVLVLAYVGGLLEVQTLARDLADWSRVASSLYTLLFAGALLAAGFLRGQVALRWAGLCGFGVVALKVTLFDLANVDTPLRVLAAGAVGGVLLLGAYAYARKRGQGDGG